MGARPQDCQVWQQVWSTTFHLGFLIFGFPVAEILDKQTRTFLDPSKAEVSPLDDGVSLKADIKPMDRHVRLAPAANP